MNMRHGFGCLLLVVTIVSAPQIASSQDKTERIKASALAGVWMGDNQRAISFGPDHKITVHLGANGKTVTGVYRLEGYSLILQERSLGTIAPMNPSEFNLVRGKT